MILLFITITSVNATTLYRPHVTVSSKTIKKNSFAYKLAPGASITHHLLINSLSYGLFERVEIGTIPIFYPDNIHRYNYNIKYNFYRSKKVSSSIGFSRLIFDLSKEKSSIANPPTEFAINYISFSINFDIGDSDYYSAFTFNRASSYANNSAFSQTYEVNDEWALDLGKKINEDYSITIGIGEHKTGVTEPTNSFGFGSTITITKKYRYLSNIGLGIQYLTDDKSALYLFSAQF